jgi:hypothetical protein
MEVYVGEKHDQKGGDMDENTMEFDLDDDDDEVEMASKFLAIVVFYSRKSFNPHILFSDMSATWGIPRLLAVQKLGGYTFKLEFTKQEEKMHVLEGGPWRHKGDALLVVHYDGMVRSSEIRIEDNGLSVHFYDLPPAMMESHARQLGKRLGRSIKMDARFPGYLRVRVDFPLSKPLVQTPQIKIKGRGPMLIMLRYENVPHFCFSCGRLGHAAFNCDEGEAKDGSVKFGEELRASPPRRVREITIKSTTPGVVKNLFPSGIAGPRVQSTRSQPSSTGLGNKDYGMQSGIKVEGQDAEAEKLKEIISNELVHSVNDL